MTTDRCPTSADVEMVSLHFADGTEFKRERPSWRIPAQLSSAKALDLSEFPGQLPYEGVVEVAIDSKGAITDVVPKEGKLALQRWLQTELADWKFIPAIEMGQKVPSAVQISLHIRRSPDQQAPWAKAAVQAPVIRVEVTGSTAANQTIVSSGMLLVSPVDGKSRPCGPLGCQIH